MEERERRMLGHEVADLVQRLEDKDARRVRKALATSGGGRQFVQLVAALYRLPCEQRLGVLARLEQMSEFRQVTR